MKSFFIFLLLAYQMVDGSQRPMDAMADLTNDLGVCILQILATMQDGNVVFSPYGIASVSVLLFEGASGNTALEILRVLNLPWNTLLARIGFRDMNRHLKTYFRSDGFLRGLVMSRDDVCFHTYYQKLLRLYGFEEPDKALTYPCNGFIPYSPATTAYPSATSEAVTVVSPQTEVTATSALPEEKSTETTATPEQSTTTVELTTVTDDNIITELTQTSQTVMLFNTTTYRSVNASNELTPDLNSKSTLQQDASATTDTMQTDTTILKTEITPFSNEISSINENLKNNLSDIITVSTQPTTTDTLITTKLNEPLLTTEFSQLKNDSVALPLQVKPTQPTTSETVLISSFSSNVNLPMDYNPSESAPEIIRIKSDRQNFTRSLMGDFQTPNISDLHHKIWNNRMKQISDRFKQRNFTDLTSFLKAFEKDFAFNSTRKNVSFPDDLFDNLSNSTNFWGNSSEEIFSSDEFQDLNEFFKKNFSIKDVMSSTEFFNFNSNGESFPFLDEKMDDEFSIGLSFNDSALSSTEFFNESSTFFSGLLEFIENTTQKVQNFVGFGTSTSTEKPITTQISNESSSTFPANDSVKRDFEIISPTIDKTSTPRSIENPLATIPTLSLSNLKKSEFANENQHNLPKKSITGENENVLPVDTKNPNNYVNVLSLKQSKLTSTKFNIKGIHPTKKSMLPMKHQNLVKNNNDKVDVVKEAKSKLKQNIAANISSNHMDMREEKVRKVRSLNHNNILNNYRGMDFPTLDWFTVYDTRSMIRIPTFTYSAMLPYTYIDDLKSKVLEIPLDDPKYSLLLLLPTYQYGLNYLLSSLTNWSVRKIHRQLQTQSVYAIIPKFRVVSHVDLKPALYSLGIKDLFHRYRADLSVMSPDARLFAKSIEQVVTVHVDKYPNAVYEVPEKFTERYFSASHPFLYFVIDRESKVSLVAGIMTDPSKQYIHFL